MNKALLVMAGLLLVSTMVFADERAEKTLKRWDNIMENATAITDKFEANGHNVEKVRQDILEMGYIKNKFSPDMKRSEQRYTIQAFHDAIKATKADLKVLEPDYGRIKLRG